MDEDTRNWLEGFEKRITEHVGAKIDAKIDHLEGWLQGELDEIKTLVIGRMDATNANVGILRRQVGVLEERVAKLESDRPMAAE